MTRYFFDVVANGELITDPDGGEYPSFDAAVTDCEQAARELLSQKARFGDPVGGMTVRIRDDRGAALREVPLLTVLKV